MLELSLSLLIHGVRKFPQDECMYINCVPSVFILPSGHDFLMLQYFDCALFHTKSTSNCSKQLRLKQLCVIYPCILNEKPTFEYFIIYTRMTIEKSLFKVSLICWQALVPNFS